VPLKVLILDFDGVLAESQGVKAEAFADLFARFPDQFETMMAFHRTHEPFSRLVKFEHLAGLLGRTGGHDFITGLMRDFSQLVEKRVAECPDVPGAREFLAEFFPKVPLYVSSHTPQDELRRIVSARGLDKFFKKVYGYPPTKKTQAVAEILAFENARPDEALFVGDAPSDREAARASGVPFIGRQSGFWPPDDPETLYPDLFAVAAAIRPRIA
jgi:phosphoglycolate phosphatase-like HAD superfamily hydrolase